MNLYDDLGVRSDATTDYVKRAFRQRAKNSHPDHGGSRAELDRLVRARNVLTDQRLRARYDKDGTIEEPAPDNADAEAMQVIVQAVDQVVNHLKANCVPWETADIVGLARAVVRDEIADTDKKIGVLIRGNDETKRFAKRFRRKTKKQSNLLKRVYEDRVRQGEAALADARHKRKALDRALEILADYAFDCDATPYDQWGVAAGMGVIQWGGS